MPEPSPDLFTLLDPAKAARLGAFLAAELPSWSYSLAGRTSLGRALTDGLALAQSPEAGPERIQNATVLCLALASEAWQRHPLDPGFTGLLRTLMGSLPGQARDEKRLSGLLPPAQALAAHAEDLGQPRLEGSTTIFREGDPQVADGLLRLAMADPAARLFWTGLGATHLLSLGALDAARALIEDGFAQTPTSPLKAHCLADWARIALAPEEAESYAAALDETLFPLRRANLLAELAYERGDHDLAVARFAAAWRMAPWQTNLALTLHTLLTRPALPPLPEEPGRIAVCCYSWNKAHELRETLASLLDSDLGGARVLCLDNGSTDATAEAIAFAAKPFETRLGPGRFLTETLPVNVGAPAARNWCLAHPAVKNAEFIAFLDDDVRLPRDWLVKLHASLAAHPGASAAGGLIHAAAPPRPVQAADWHLLPPEAASDAERSFADYEEHLFVANTAIGLTEHALLAYQRPCASVSGCCHLLRRAAIAEHGPFDVRFTPSQFDDLERDLRSLAAGSPSIYDGSLRVAHTQYSSLAQADSPAKTAHVMGNKLKLEYKLGRAAIDELAARSRELAVRHLVRVLTELPGLVADIPSPPPRPTRPA